MIAHAGEYILMMNGKTTTTGYNIVASHTLLSPMHDFTATDCKIFYLSLSLCTKVKVAAASEHIPEGFTTHAHSRCSSPSFCKHVCAMVLPALKTQLSRRTTWYTLSLIPLAILFNHKIEICPGQISKIIQ